MIIAILFHRYWSKHDRYMYISLNTNFIGLTILDPVFHGTYRGKQAHPGEC